MDENTIKALWRSANKKWEERHASGKTSTEDITQLKIQGLLSSMKPLKLFALVVGIVWVGTGLIILGNNYLHNFSVANKFFLFSASIQVVLTGLAVLIYLYQLIAIHRIDLTAPIIQTQEKITNLKKLTLWTARLLFLQLPVWTTFYWNETMFQEWVLLQWLMQLILTFSLAFIAIWLFINIKSENRNKTWFRLIFEGKEWTPLMKSLELLDQIETLNEKN